MVDFRIKSKFNIQDANKAYEVPYHDVDEYLYKYNDKLAIYKGRMTEQFFHEKTIQYIYIL
jgi:hypothetical protein